MLKIFETFNSAAGDAPRKEPRGRRPMNMLKAVCASLALMTSSYGAMPASAAESGKVLVILSSASQLELREGKTYHTGYYLDELAIPLRKIVDAGYSPVFANPKGNAGSFDPS